MKTLLTAAAMIAALTGVAAAADAQGKYETSGPGGRTCAEYTAASKDAAVVVGVWLQGYTTALNQVISGTTDVTGGRNESQLTAELGRVCKSKPQLLLADAAHEMVAKMTGGSKQASAKTNKKAKDTAPAADALPELRR